MSGWQRGHRRTENHHRAAPLRCYQNRATPCMKTKSALPGCGWMGHEASVTQSPGAHPSVLISREELPVTYAWNSRDRLCPPRMVWFKRNYHYPEFEIARMHKRRIRAYNRVERPAESRVKADRWNRQRFPGRTGEWPLNQKARRRKCPISS